MVIRNYEYLIVRQILGYPERNDEFASMQLNG